MRGQAWGAPGRDARLRGSLRLPRLRGCPPAPPSTRLPGTRCTEWSRCVRSLLRCAASRTGGSSARRGPRPRCHGGRRFRQHRLMPDTRVVFKIPRGSENGCQQYPAAPLGTRQPPRRPAAPAAPSGPAARPATSEEHFPGRLSQMSEEEPRGESADEPSRSVALTMAACDLFTADGHHRNQPRRVCRKPVKPQLKQSALISTNVCVLLFLEYVMSE